MQRPQQNPGDTCTPLPSPFGGGPPLFSPTFSRSPVSAAASADVVSEHPCVTLREWWLARVEGHERKIAVAGFFEGNQAVLDFPAAPIAKRHESEVLETENGTVVFIYGILNIKRTLGNGFTIETCEKFSCGFPQWWEIWMCDPKMMSSQTGSQLRSSGTSNSREDSSRFYLERFQEGKLLDRLTRIYNARNNVEAFSGNGDAFPHSSCLPNGAPRFEEYPCDDEGHPKTPVVSLKRQGCLKKHQSVALSESILGEDTPTLHCADVELSEKVIALCKGEQPVGSRKQRLPLALRRLQRARRLHPAPYGNLSPITHGWSKSSSVSTPESLKLKKTRSGRPVVPRLDPGCQSIVYDHDGSIAAIIGLDSPKQLKGSTSKNYARKKKRNN